MRQWRQKTSKMTQFFGALRAPNLKMVPVTVSPLQTDTFWPKRSFPGALRALTLKRTQNFKPPLVSDAFWTEMSLASAREARRFFYGVSMILPIEIPFSFKKHIFSRAARAQKILNFWTPEWLKFWDPPENKGGSISNNFTDPPVLEIDPPS